MRYAGILSLALTAALLSLGCGINTTPESESNAKITNAKEKIKDAAGATAEAARAKRDEYAIEMHKQLDGFDVKCKELEARITKAEGQAKKDLERKLEEAKVKRDVAAKKLGELKEAGAERWEKVKEGVGKALDDLKKVFE
jgi:TolA-binding protein